MKMSPIDINIETLILVTVWNQPNIFQGCFKISTLDSQHEEYLLFRCEVHNAQQKDFIEHEFCPENYHMTHLYIQEQKISLDQVYVAQESALYLLNYALYTTIKTMLINKPQKQQSLSMDDIFVDSLFEKIKPILNKETGWDESLKEIGFAVAMDFCPREKMGENAVQTLLMGFVNHDFIEKKIH
ncbi:MULTISPECIES: hypothetical protein [Legionella]|uniref:Uncharacterized protein n=1 Tax=Legionella steelei TaxID=947033 RepID=A0A0W0ZHC7_9GAMM|nr:MULTISPECIES: hypothetical protein [Legionella]KTD68230.1 hypothetical protein Lste_1388 [Legionella steelei]OJW12070.1 MAG: hypothetical protein BGO44_03295 [Legionella sp. 39-23]